MFFFFFQLIHSRKRTIRTVTKNHLSSHKITNRAATASKENRRKRKKHKKSEAAKRKNNDPNKRDLHCSGSPVCIIPLSQKEQTSPVQQIDAAHLARYPEGTRQPGRVSNIGQHQKYQGWRLCTASQSHMPGWGRQTNITKPKNKSSIIMIVVAVPRVGPQSQSQ